MIQRWSVRYGGIEDDINGKLVKHSDVVALETKVTALEESHKEIKEWAKYFACNYNGYLLRHGWVWDLENGEWTITGKNGGFEFMEAMRIELKSILAKAKS